MSGGDRDMAGGLWQAGPPGSRLWDGADKWAFVEEGGGDRSAAPPGSCGAEVALRAVPSWAETARPSHTSTGGSPGEGRREGPDGGCS